MPQKKTNQLYVEKSLNQKFDEQELQELEAAIQERIVAITSYNKDIDNHLPMYTSIVPSESVLIRLYLREPKLTEQGIYIPEASAQDMVERKRTAASGDRYTQKLTETPWKWTTKAVIVALPEFLQKYKIGDLVQVPYLNTASTVREDESLLMTFEYAFLHCDSNQGDIPRDCLDPHFGYALIPSHLIKCKL